MEQQTQKLSRHILVVDDEPQVCDFLAEALTHLGHTVEIARDGLEALRKAEEFPFHIVITDMNMPGMDGMELIKKLLEDHKNVDIIAITGHSMRYRYTDVIAAGAADFISKPFTINELEAKLERILRERRVIQELEKLAIRDPLTGLYNRRVFVKIARKEAVRSHRYQHTLFLFFCDVDNFKQYNDIYGHRAGDRLLIELAGVLRSSVRKDVDTPFRYGGDEFTLLLPHLPTDRALTVADRIRERYNQLDLTPTFLSIGIAQYHNKNNDIDRDIEDMVQRSDKALYHAKHHLGGNSAHMDNEL